MAFGAQKIFPIDIKARYAVGVNLPFSSPSVFTSNYLTKDAIKNNLINFFLTEPGERYLNPNFGSGLRSFVFEQITEDNMNLIEDKISGMVHDVSYMDGHIEVIKEYLREDMGYDNTLPPFVDEVPRKKKKKEENFETYNDYPEAAKNNACRAIKWAEENGWGDCGTAVGKMRANQLCGGENISEETISRMASFERHRQNKDVKYDEGCGGLMWDAWGGTEGIEWAQRKLDQLEKEKMSKQKFVTTDEEKRIVVGPAMVPDLKIFRKDEMGRPYYVYFSADTIKMIAEKYMRYKYIDNNDTNHNGEAAKDVYVIETWIKEDGRSALEQFN